MENGKKGNVIYSYDVASYYPNIIINCGLYPKQLGEDFLNIYKEIVESRLIAKSTGDKIKSDSYKILINSAYGKSGSPYSIMYAPEMLVQVTVTGQLSLLMLIAELENNSIPVVSANTDGIVIKCPFEHENLMISIIRDWENKTGFTMEKTKYRGLYSQSVNNYIAIKDTGEMTLKGCFGMASIAKNPQSEICNMAMIDYLRNGTLFEDTIRACKDITKFLSIRTVKGGAMCNGKLLGKAIRWYYARGYQPKISYAKSGNLVPKSYGAKPLMTLPDTFPLDIDYDYYIEECNKLFG